MPSFEIACENLHRATTLRSRCTCCWRCRLQFITICGGKKSGTFFNVKIEQDDDDGTFEIDGETIKAKTTKALLNKFIKS